MKTAAELKRLLQSIDHKGYPAYKDTRGGYQFEGYQLFIDHVQADPFAPPSRLSLRISGGNAGFPREAYTTRHRRVALQDYLVRLFYQKVEPYAAGSGGSGKSGLLCVSRCGQEVLERTACAMNPQTGDITVRLAAGFPARGRSIDAQTFIRMVFDFLPGAVHDCFLYRSLKAAEVQKLLELSDDRQAIRDMLSELGLCAFVANGAILPRESGVSQRPMRDAVPFVSPPSMEVALRLPHAGEIRGMGIKKGVTLIVGGGFHGKSTLLKALEMGVYDHIAGDGREFVVTDGSAVKLRAEDGRSIQNVDISLFINHLPGGRDTRTFRTPDASGSTSQAANLVEAWESGCTTFLIDEDTCATNFMIRDELMQRVVHRDQEPIQPFIERVRALYEKAGISTILVAGSSGLFSMLRILLSKWTVINRKKLQKPPKKRRPPSRRPPVPKGVWKRRALRDIPGRVPNFSPAGPK